MVVRRATWERTHEQGNSGGGCEPFGCGDRFGEVKARRRSASAPSITFVLLALLIGPRFVGFGPCLVTTLPLQPERSGLVPSGRPTSAAGEPAATEKGSNQMRLKFVLLGLIAALMAFAVPASAMAATAMNPGNTSFQIIGGSTPPTIKTSLGSCTISNIQGTTPAQPNTPDPTVPVTVTAGSCSSGASISLSGQWNLKPRTTTRISLGPVSASGLTMRFASAPGCKLVLTSYSSVPLLAVWTNAVYPAVNSTYHAESSIGMNWENDAPGTCLRYGAPETGKFEQVTSTGASASSVVQNRLGIGGPIRLDTVSG